MKTLIRWILILCFLILLSGCRTRLLDVPADHALPSGLAASGSGNNASEGESLPAAPAEPSSEGGETRENPGSSLKEYDENASAEIIPGTDRELHGPGEGNGSGIDGDNGPVLSRLNDEAEDTALLTLDAEKAEKAGVSDDAKAAESMMRYYSVLLEDRVRSLYECKRGYVYWETAEDHVTIFKTSPEHQIIINAGAYNVSSRLLAENLRVDDGWIARKDPGIIVKVVGSDVLGASVRSAAYAEAVTGVLKSRPEWAGINAVRNRRIVLFSEELLTEDHLVLGAALILAKISAPEQFADLDPDQALKMLISEATGEMPDGIYYYFDEGWGG